MSKMPYALLGTFHERCIMAVAFYDTVDKESPHVQGADEGRWQTTRFLLNMKNIGILSFVTIKLPMVKL